MIKNLFYKKLIVKLANGNKEQMIQEISKMASRSHKKIGEIISETGSDDPKDIVEFICKQLKLNTNYDNPSNA